MIVVGISSTIAIILSQSLLKQPSQKEKTEQAEKNADFKIISAPSDVVPGGIVQVNDVDRSLLEIFINEEPKALKFECDTSILSEYFNILFRAIISPNAP